MDDLIWVNPEASNRATSDAWHDACTEPRAGYIAYVRVDRLAPAERDRLTEEKGKTNG